MCIDVVEEEPVLQEDTKEGCQNLRQEDIRGLSQRFVDNMDNFVQTRNKTIFKTTAILPILLTIYIRNLNRISLLLMTIC